MDQEQVKAVLREADFFRSLDDDRLGRVAAVGTSHEHKAGDLVARQGEQTDSFGVVASGAFDVFLDDEVLEVERPMGELRPGDVFGDIGLLTETTQSANIRSKEEGVTIRFPRDDFMKLLQEDPTITLSMAATLAHRLDATSRARSIRMERLGSYTLEPDVVRLLPLQVIERYKVIPVERKDLKITIALVDPEDFVARNTVAAFLEEYDHEWVCITQDDFNSFVEARIREIFRTPGADEESAELFYFLAEGQVAEAPQTEAAKLFDRLVKKAVDAGASDLHFEPNPEGVNVRCRIDGRMTEIHPALGYQIYRPLVSRVKVVTQLNLAERRLPQDASIRMGYRRRSIDMRVSTLPTPTGESVVCHLLDPNRRYMALSELIIDDRVLSMVSDLFACPNGMVLVTGPTGAGKTTTLYAGLRSRLQDNPTIKLVTAEDPVEYELEDVTQVQVSEEVGLTFSRILRSLLRQDPDVLLVGEIRDQESLQIVLEASLTGHLVLSSLHTNSALETIMRLRHRGAEDYAVASALRGMISQRLVPRLCSACHHPSKPTKEEIQILRDCWILKPDEDLDEVWSASGCPHCRSLGRRGRVAVYELTVVTNALRDVIETGCSYADLKDAMTPDSFVPMRRYALHLLKKGLVGIEDLMPLFRGVRLRGNSEGH